MRSKTEWSGNFEILALAAPSLLHSRIRNVAKTMQILLASRLAHLLIPHRNLMIEWILHRPPHASSPTEIRVAELLRRLADSPYRWIVVWGYDYRDDRGTEREGDFLVLGPAGGLLVLEVKSWLPRYFPETGRWEGAGGDDPIQLLIAPPSARKIRFYTSTATGSERERREEFGNPVLFAAKLFAVLASPVSFRLLFRAGFGRVASFGKGW